MFDAKCSAFFLTILFFTQLVCIRIVPRLYVFFNFIPDTLDTFPVKVQPEITTLHFHIDSTAVV